MYLTIEELKKHLNVDHSEDDAYIKELIEVAEDSVSEYLQAPLSEFCESHADGKCPHEVLKPSIRHAIRLLVGTWYANRESVTFGNAQSLPHSVSYLLTPLRKY